MVVWNHQLDGHEFEQTLGLVERQGSLQSCNPWGHKESDMTEQLKKNNSEQPTDSFEKSMLGKI